MTATKIQSGWRETTLGMIAQINPSESLKKGMKAKAMSMDQLLPYTRKIAGYEVKAYAGGSKFRNGDTLLARITPCLENGKTACVDILDENEVGFGSTEFIVIREKRNESDQKFLYYFSTSPAFRDAAIKSMTGTSGRQRVQTDLIANKTFLFPPVEEQRAIGQALSVFDDKIELLRNQNKTLEAIAQQLFHEWFVDFNFPNADGKPYKESGGKMVGGELGEMPEGWKVGKVGEIVELFDSQRVPLASDVRAKRKGMYPYYGATTIMDYIDDYLFDGIYLLLAEDGSVQDDHGLPVLQYVWGQFWVNNHAHILKGTNGWSAEMLYLLFKKTPVASIVTGAVQPKINQKNLTDLEIVIPTSEVLVKFDIFIQAIFDKTRNNSDHVKTLSTLRDFLLPHMMSGEVRVKETVFNQKV